MMPFALLRQFRKPAQVLPRFLPQRLYYPFASASRMAVVPPGLTPRQMLRYLKGCLAIAAPVEDLALLARAGESGEIHPIPVFNALVAFTGTQFGALEESERDLLWRVFQVPVFEQCIGSDGQVLAVECDAHDGLHVLTADQRPPEGFTARSERTPCGCGRATPRWMGLRRSTPVRRDAVLSRP